MQDREAGPAGEATEWVIACDVADVEEEDVVRFDRVAATYAVYRTTTVYYATDGYCTHERGHFSGCFVIDDVIECPLPQGWSHISSGKALSRFGYVALMMTCPVRLADAGALVSLPQTSSQMEIDAA